MSSIAPSAPDTQSPTPVQPRRGLLRVLGVTFGLAVIIGNTIGAGILRTPGSVAEQLPSTGWYLAAWIAGGVYALLGAVSLAELGTLLPRSGGLYVFARHALGRYAGFLVGWIDWAATCGSVAAVAVLIGEYAGGLVPALEGRTVPVAMAVTLAFATLQWRGIRTAGATQTVTSAAKALVLLALVGACFVLPATPPPLPSVLPTLPAGAALLAAVIVALQGVIYTYDGWTGVIYFSGEVKDPARDIPRSMIGGVIAVTAIYLLLNLAFLHVVPLPALAGEPLAAAAAARAVLGPVGDTVIRVVLIVALLSAVNALALMAPRVLYAMSDDGLVPRAASAVNRGGTPTGALVASTVVALAFIATGAFNTIIAVLAFFFVANYVLAFACVFVLRRREPDAPRPYRAWGYPWTTGAALLGSVAFLVGAVASDRRTSLYALAVLAASVPAYLLAARWINRTEGKMTIQDEEQAPSAEAEAESEGLDPKVELLWQINAALGWVFWIAVASVSLFLADRSPWWALVIAFLAVMYTMHVPPRRFRRFTFRVGDADVRVSRGWLWRTESVVLHSRIQHVDTRQGPVERMLGLATVVVFTAGSVGAMVTVPGLAADRADALRDQLVRLSGTDDAV